MNLHHDIELDRATGAMVATCGTLVDDLRTSVEESGALGRSQYARDVLMGQQRVSGSDLKGTARKFGSSYARQRGRVTTAWKAAGGCVATIGPHRERVLAILLP